MSSFRPVQNMPTVRTKGKTSRSTDSDSGRGLKDQCEQCDRMEKLLSVSQFRIVDLSARLVETEELMLCRG